jgi:hypothetical protein
MTNSTWVTLSAREEACIAASIVHRRIEIFSANFWIGLPGGAIFL